MGQPEHVRILAVFAYVLLTAAVISGELLSGRLAPPGARRTLFSLHRAASISGLALGLGHGLSQLGSGTALQAVIGLSAVTGMAVPVFAWVSRRPIGIRWRLIHHVAYLAFAAATIHAVMFHDGTMPHPEMVLYGVAVTAVLGLALFRAATESGRTARARSS
jgi:hypothetical protein